MAEGMNPSAIFLSGQNRWRGDIPLPPINLWTEEQRREAQSFLSAKDSHHIFHFHDEQAIVAFKIHRNGAFGIE